MTAILPAIRPAIGPAITSVFGGRRGGGVRTADPAVLRARVLAGGVTPDAPLVAIGDSHTDEVGAPQYMWNDLRTVRTQGGEGLEGVDPASIVAVGHNGMSLSVYNSGNYLDAVIALSPAVTVSCWLTNDVRLGGLGLTVPDIAAVGAALLNEHVSRIKAAAPDCIVVLRVPAPYLTINEPAFNYITDGTNVNPPGLAQIYTTGVRAAHYRVLQTHPDVLIYDPQQRLFGTTSPTSAGDYFADQIHQNATGYQAEARDFAEWVGAAVPYDQTQTDAALIASPYAPWGVYSRAVEDASRFLQIGSATAVGVAAGNAYLDFGPSLPDAPPARFDNYDLIETVGARAVVVPRYYSMFAGIGDNTRLSLAGGGTTVEASAVQFTKVRVYRQILSGDPVVNAVLLGGSPLIRVGRISGGGPWGFDVSAASLSDTLPAETAAEWIPDLLPGDMIVVEGGGSVSADARAPSSAALRIFNNSTDWNPLHGRIAVVYRP